MNAFPDAIKKATRACRHGPATVLAVMLLFGSPATAQYVLEPEQQKYMLELEQAQRMFELKTQATGRKFARNGASAADAGDWMEACQNYMLAVALGGTDGYRQFLAGVTTILNETERERCRKNARVEYAALVAAEAERAERAGRIAACMMEAGLEGQDDSTLSRRSSAIIQRMIQCITEHRDGTTEYDACIEESERREAELEADEAILVACTEQAGN